MIFLIYTILAILQQNKGMETEVTDPCPSTIVKSTVADMCKSSSGTEETKNGSYTVDSVVLRIMIQQDDCICRVMIDHQIDNVTIGISKYNGLTVSAPEEANCGLAVDIKHIHNMSTTTVIDPIKCLVDNTLRYTIPFQNNYLKFKSRIINGDFTRGYCIRIQRDINSNHSQVLRIDCDGPMTTELTTERIRTSDSPQSSPQTTTSEISSTNSSNIDSTTTITSTNVKDQSTTTTTDTTTGLEQTTYIAIGAGSGVALILLVVLVVICLRRKSTQKAGTNGYVDNTQDENDDKLPDNELYVPAVEFDIIGGKCSTADVDMPKSSKKTLSMEGDYSTVDDVTRKSPNERLSVEGNYSTVDEDMPKCSNERLSVDGNYSTVDEDMQKSYYERLSVDGNYSTVELDEHLEGNCSYSENSELGQTKGKQKPTIKPKPKSHSINSEENRSADQNIKHITAPNGSENMYAVVHKSIKHVPTTNVGKGEVTCQQDQTYAVVDKARTRKSSPNETNKKKFEINSNNRV